MQDQFSPDIVVIGCGYVGYPLSLQFAGAGYSVLAVDVDERVVASVNAGQPLLAEPAFAAAAHGVHVTGRLRSSSEPHTADVFIIAVPTPVDATGRRADVSIVADAARSILPFLRPGNMVVVESTVPPGTCQKVVLPLLEESGLSVGEDVLLAHCPERVYPGSTIDELVHSARVIGGVDERSTKSAMDLYSSFVEGDLVATDIVTAELCKVMENTFRDVNIALANQVAEIAELHGIEGAEIARLANGHPRVNYLVPGIGVGGHCIPVDPWFLLSDTGLIDEGVIGAARGVNDRQPLRVARKIVADVEGISTPRIVIVGASYKPGVADTRNSPALHVASTLSDLGFDISIYDPLVHEFSGDLLQLVKGADLVVVLVRQQAALEQLDLSREEIERSMRRPRVVDMSTGTIVEI